ncbi:MAG: hypothetical protein GY898_32095 [Proteobacteria bacterium]|nr:hypothetical protein [Pseudomonadota bacterium]
MSDLGPTCALHPDRPSQGTCAHCGTFSCGSCLGWLGGRQICITCKDEGRVAIYGIPWEQRDQLGLFTAWARTAGMLYTQPVQFFRKVDPYGPIGGAVLFAAISGLWLALLYLTLVTVVGALLGLAIAFGGSNWDPSIAIVVAIVGVVYTIVPPLSLVLGGFIWGLVHHVVMLLAGGASKGLGATARVALFTSPIQLFQFVPCLNYVAWAWYLPVMGIGYTQVHEQSGGKSAAGILLPVLGCCFCYIGLYAFIFAVEGL